MKFKIEINNSVGPRLIRILRGISQDDLARDCGFDRALISRAERGYPVSRRIKSKISAVLEMPEHMLFPKAKDEHKIEVWTTTPEDVQAISPPGLKNKLRR